MLQIWSWCQGWTFSIYWCLLNNFNIKKRKLYSVLMTHIILLTVKNVFKKMFTHSSKYDQGPSFWASTFWAVGCLIPKIALAVRLNFGKWLQVELLTTNSIPVASKQPQDWPNNMNYGAPKNWGFNNVLTEKVSAMKTYCECNNNIQTNLISKLTLSRLTSNYNYIIFFLPEVIPQNGSNLNCWYCKISKMMEWTQLLNHLTSTKVNHLIIHLTEC
jgi:hypothetical protein